MRVVVLADAVLKEELMMQGVHESLELDWINDPALFAQQPAADACIDLLFEYTDQRIALLDQLPGKTIIVSSVIHALDDLPSHFVRINGWASFLKRPIIEAAYKSDAVKEKAAPILSFFNKKIAWVPDEPGFITARVIAMIINEAYYALEEKVSTKQEIDTAMKLGTNYPYGPFEWSEKIGLKNIAGLLEKLYKETSRYQAAPLLKKEASL